MELDIKHPMNERYYGPVNWILVYQCGSIHLKYDSTDTDLLGVNRVRQEVRMPFSDWLKWSVSLGREKRHELPF